MKKTANRKKSHCNLYWSKIFKRMIKTQHLWSFPLRFRNISFSLCVFLIMFFLKFGKKNFIWIQITTFHLWKKKLTIFSVLNQIKNRKNILSLVCKTVHRFSAIMTLSFQNLVLQINPQATLTKRNFNHSIQLVSPFQSQVKINTLNMSTNKKIWKFLSLPLISNCNLSNIVLLTLKNFHLEKFPNK